MRRRAGGMDMDAARRIRQGIMARNAQRRAAYARRKGTAGSSGG